MGTSHHVDRQMFAEFGGNPSTVALALWHVDERYTVEI